MHKTKSNIIYLSCDMYLATCNIKEHNNMRWQAISWNLAQSRMHIQNINAQYNFIEVLNVIGSS